MRKLTKPAVTGILSFSFDLFKAEPGVGELLENMLRLQRKYDLQMQQILVKMGNTCAINYCCIFLEENTYFEMYNLS